MPDTEPQFYDLDDVAAVTRLSRRTIEALIAVGTIRSFKLGRRRLVNSRFLAEDLERLATDRSA